MRNSNEAVVPEGVNNLTPDAKSIKAEATMETRTAINTDLQYESGKKNEMFTKIRAKLGKIKEELASLIAKL